MKKALLKIRKIIENLIDYIPDEARPMLPMAGIALLAVVLIIIIVIAQGCGAGKTQEPQTEEVVFEETEAETISALSDTEEDAADIPETEPEEDYGNLTKNGDPEILNVMTRYFTARANGDLDTINALYGIENPSEEDLAEDREVLQFNARYISSFDDITTYVMDGPYDNSWLVYTTTDISFYTCSSKAPTIMWCFIEKDDDGEYHILDSHRLTSDLNEYAEEENHTPEVRALAADVNTRLLEALESDPDLEETYGILRSGSPLWENTDEAETEVAVIEEEEEPVSQGTRQTEADDGDEDEAGEEVEETESEQETIAPFGNENEAAMEGPDTASEGLTVIENGVGPGEAAEIVSEAGPAGELTPIEPLNAD